MATVRNSKIISDKLNVVGICIYVTGLPQNIIIMITVCNVLIYSRKQLFKQIWPELYSIL
jgi:hypothetical protein